MIIPIKLPKEQKDQVIGNVRAYFENERSEEIGELAAGQLVETEKMNALEEELYSLEIR